MEPNTPSVFLSDPDVTLWHGDVLATLRDLPAESVDCVVTSPPYWGLRDYGQEGQLGLEPTPEQYVERMVEVFREVRRVLAAHGTVWLNLGDSYASFKGNPGVNSVDPKQPARRGWVRPNDWRLTEPGTGEVQEPSPDLDASGGDETVLAHALGSASLKPKDLVGIPWRVAFALQADGWYLRSDIIWAKPNPMPESVTDRPTKAHEYVFLLSKQPRYFFDQEAVRERYGDPAREWWNETRTSPGNPDRNDGGGVQSRPARGPDGRKVTTVQGANGSIQHRDGERWPNGGRNVRSVWEIATQPFSGRELFGGDGRIPSPDCPRHGDRPVPAPTGRRGGHEDADLSRTPRSDDRLAQEPQDGPVPTEPILAPDSAPASSDSPPHASTATATPNSTRTRKTSSRSDERDTDGEQTLGRTRHTEPSDGLLALDGFDTHDSSETTDRKAHKSGLTGGAYSPPGQAPHGNARDRELPCTCKYIDHFATFPEELARRCIAAGCPEQVCRVCGKARERVVETSGEWRAQHERPAKHNGDVYRTNPGGGVAGVSVQRERQELGFTDCECLEPDGSLDGPRPGDARDKYRPGITLDPFMGSGTVAFVARKLGRHAVGIDLSAEYLELAARRLQQQSLFAEVV